ncbi:MAG: formylglycine-generating enzyme family protein [Treponema sp.]|jgi:formylglycine-generating enzyme required for sulfatase activity|nr:formylglycine-generating enzyme family protein [Treponema sp.]
MLNIFRSALLFSLIFSAYFISADDDFVLIEGGSFIMGSPTYERGRNNGERPHRVTVNPFFMGKYQITQEEYERVMETNPSLFRGSNLPVENVSWFDAIEYCNRRSQLEGLTPAYTINIFRVDLNNLNSTTRWLVTWNREATGYRLPTEAEWEYAAKGGDESPGAFLFSGTNIQSEVAWYAINSGSSTHPVGTKDANSLGLYDMSGNVWEWCWDWYGDYTAREQTDPAGAPVGSHRVIRGGSWYDSAAYIRSAARYFWIPSTWSTGIGFRIVRSALPENWTEFLLIR